MIRVGAFEHIMTLLSFVYALAIAHLLGTVARLTGRGSGHDFRGLTSIGC